MRAQEEKYFQRKKAEAKEAMKEEEAAVFQDAIAPAMAEVDSMLKESGDSVSDAGLEAIARWKLGI